MKWVGMTVLGTVVLVLVAVLVSWLLPVPAAERAALAAMDAAPRGQVPERNAFPPVWLLPYDGIDPARVHALTAEDAQRFAQAISAQTPQGWSNSVAEGRYPKATPATGWCGLDTESCLGEVRDQAAAVAQAHAGHDGLHARISAVGRNDHYRNLFPSDIAMPFPPMQVLLERLSLHALAHVQGDSRRALQGVCEDIGTGRMLMRSSDSLLVAMVGSAMAARNAALFTEILSELPADVPLPAICPQVLGAPTAAELDMCVPMRGEFGYQRAAGARLPHAQSRWLYDVEKTQARAAALLSRSCAPEVQQQIREDRRVRLAEPPSEWSLACVANVAGCMTQVMVAPTYVGYNWRIQDAGAQLRLAAAMLWLRGQPNDGHGAMATLARLPAALGSAQRPLQPAADGRSVQVKRYGRPSKDAPAMLRARLPLPWQPQ
jgi:hypothetical protein